MGSITPAHQALVLDTPTGSAGAASGHDALRLAAVSTGSSHESGATDSTHETGHRQSLSTEASRSLGTAAAPLECDPLAGAALSSTPRLPKEHPLSPEVSLAEVSRTSYIRAPVLPGVSPVSNVIFPDDEEDIPSSEGVAKQADAQSSMQVAAARRAAIPAALQENLAEDKQGLPVVFRLPRAPHRLSAEVVDDHLRSALPKDLRGVILAQEISRQLERTERELDELRALQHARENSLIALLRETSSVSESLISRTLVRAKAEVGLSSNSKSPDNHAWRIVLNDSSHDTTPGTIPVSRPPLAEDLQDAMFENDFTEATGSISPTMSANCTTSPRVRQTGSPSPAPFLATSLYERRGRQSSQSLSARLFGGFTPPSTSYLSPTSDSFHANTVMPNSASSAEGSPANVTGLAAAKKSRANSIRSVTSAMSHQSNRGLSGWAGSLWSWNKNGRTRYFSDDDEEDEGQSEEDVTPVASSSSFARAHASAKQVAGSGTGSRTTGRSRTLSKSSSNSASTKSWDTTAATSFSSHATTHNRPAEDGHPGELRTSPSVTSTLTLEDSGKAERFSPIGKEGPVRTLLARRPSALHPDAALTTRSVTAPVTAASSPLAPLSGELRSLPTSTSILQSLASYGRDQEAQKLSHEVPSHFRAVSESASTIGKSSGVLVAGELFRAPGTVSTNISEWTCRLLTSFKGDTLPEILATASTPTSVDMDRTSSKSPSTSRSISPRIAQTQSKGALSPAAVLSDSTSKPVRLSVSSVSSHDATFASFIPDEAVEAMPLAINETHKHKQKGYIATAKGTIGRALGLGSSSNSKATGNPMDPDKKAKACKIRSNSLKAVVEPALTLPATFTSFSSPSNAVSPSATVAPHSDNHPRQAPLATPLEMGTIVPPEAKPPTLSNDLADQMKNGPLVDRFGFVYDIKVGMKLLKEYRKQQEFAGESVISLDSPIEVNVEDLQAAIGPSPSPTPGIETALNSAALHLADEHSSREPHAAEKAGPEPSFAMVSGGPASSTTDGTQLPSNQSIRRLLNQLGEMNESVEQSQKEAWDHFILRRRKKAQRPPKDDEAAIAAKARKKRATFVEAPLSMATSNADDEQIDNQFADNLVGVASMGADKKDDKIFRHLVRSGIPIAYRPSIWAEVSGASEIREPGVYQELLSRHAGESSPCLEQIDMDTHRTFPTNVFFAGSGPGVAKLRRVLIAYSWRDPSIGYCQGMNLLAALLLLVYPDEEDAFWMLASVLERTLPSDYYSSQLLVSQADQRVLQDLIQLALPELYDHLEDLGVDLPAITFGWFLSLFTDALPIQTLLRVWDVLLVYGPISLFKIAIAIFKIHSAEIFATDSASNFYVLLTNLTSHLYSADKLLKTAFEDLKFIKRYDVESRRLKHVADIEQELAPRNLTPALTSSPSTVDPKQHEIVSGTSPSTITL